MKRVSVLLVDDDEAIRNSLGMFLEDFGFTVESTGSGDEALRLLLEDRFDVAVMDLRLVETDAETIIQSVRAVQKRTRFLIYTGSLPYRMSAEFAEMSGMRLEDVIYKPAKSLSVLADAIIRLSAGDDAADGRDGARV